MRSRRRAVLVAAVVIGAGAVPAAAHDSGAEHATTAAPLADLTIPSLGSART